jgi:hypothetical protein
MVGLLVCQALKKGGGKGMNNRQGKNNTADDVDGGGIHDGCLTLSKCFYCIDKSVK